MKPYDLGERVVVDMHWSPAQHGTVTRVWPFLPRLVQVTLDNGEVLAQVAVSRLHRMATA